MKGSSVCLWVFFLLAPSAGEQFWCPSVQNVTPSRNGCDPTARPWLFIWSAGRSGSTTLLDMVNVLPGIYLTGENAMTEEASKLWYSWYMRSARMKEGRGEDGISQRGQLSFQPFKCALQDWFASIPPVKEVQTDKGIVVLGWKDVHFESRHFEFLNEVFPCSRFIFNVRHSAAAQSESGQHKGKVSAAYIATKNDEIRQLHAKLGPERSYLLHLEDYNTTTFAGLFAWLGFPACKPAKIVHNNRDGWTPDRLTDRSSIVGRDCVFNPMKTV